MSPDASAPTATRRRRGVLIALGVVVVLLAVGAAYLLGTQRPNVDPGTTAPPVVSSSTSATSAPTSTPPIATASSPSGSGTSVPPAGAGLADGCLGGPDPFAAMLVARAAADPGITGAAALARTYGRWAVTFPIDPQPTQALAAVIGPDTGTFLTNTVDSLNQLARQLQSSGYTEGKPLPDDAMYRVQRGATDDYTVIDQVVTRQLTRSDGRVETTKIAMTIVLAKDENGWGITGTLPPLSNDPFAASPSNPWLFYDGVC